MSESAKELQRIYQNRFQRTSEYRKRVWQVLTSSIFNRWIPAEAAVLHYGCRHGVFINNVKAVKDSAMDFSPDAKRRMKGRMIFAIAARPA